MWQFLKVLGRNLVQGPATEPFPFQEAATPAAFRGRVTLDPERCMGCHICQHVCAGRAIRIEENKEKNGYRLTVWHNSCALCGMCHHFCPTKAISLSNDWHSAHVQDDKYNWADHYEIPYLACSGCGAPMRILPPDVAARVYAHSPLDMERLMRLCPKCRQIAAAERYEDNQHDPAAKE